MCLHLGRHIVCVPTLVSLLELDFLCNKARKDRLLLSQGIWKIDLLVGCLGVQQPLLCPLGGTCSEGENMLTAQTESIHSANTGEGALHPLRLCSQLTVHEVF